MRRLGILVVGLVTALMMVMPAGALAAPPETKTTVCHVEGNGNYHAIEVAAKAVPAHLDHGDGLIGGPVPEMDGYVFGEGCVAELAGPAPGCYDDVIGIDPDLFYSGPVDTVGNLTPYWSQDGTCSGDIREDMTWALVIADDVGEATAKCDALAPPEWDIVGNLNFYGFVEFPPDAWFCYEPI